MIDLSSPLAAQELKRIIDERVDVRLQASQPRTMYGVVEDVDSGKAQASVFVQGESVAAQGYSYEEWLQPVVGDRVRVVNRQGDRYIERVLTGSPVSGPQAIPGLIGDGIADDGPAIQAAINIAAARVPQGGELYLPPGNHRITQKLSLASGVYLIGSSNRASRITLDSLTEHAIEVLGTSAVATKVQCGLRNLAIVGPGKASGGVGAGVHLKWASYGLVFENLWINGFGSHGAFAEDTYTASWRDVQFDGNGGDGFRGVLNINNMEFARCVSILNGANGFYIEGGASVVFLATDSESNVQAGFDLRYLTTASLLSSHMEKNGTDLVSPNIRLHYKTSLSDKAQSVAIMGCIIQGQSVTADGILADGSERALILGNWFANHTNAHIRTTANATRTTIGPNQYSGVGTLLIDASSSTWASLYGPSKTVTINPGSIPAGSTANQFVSMPSAAVGDAVAIGPPAALEAGLVVTGYVSAADIVQIRIANVTGAAIDPASGSWRVVVMKA